MQMGISTSLSEPIAGTDIPERHPKEDQNQHDKEEVKHFNYLPRPLELLYMIAERDYISNKEEGKNYYISLRNRLYILSHDKIPWDLSISQIP